jgi:F-type H+-transporting ATPase subunit b
VLTYFADEGHATAEAATHASESAGGLAALGLNWQSFLFQLITFVIVLLILRQFVFKKLIATLEARRQTVEDSLKHAAETEEKLKKTEETIAGMLAEARKQADDVVGASHKEASQLVEAAEAKAVQRAEHIVKEAKSQMDVEITKAREALKTETAKLVAQATEKIIKEKLNATKDATLISAALKREDA